ARLERRGIGEASRRGGESVEGNRRERAGAGCWRGRGSTRTQRRRQGAFHYATKLVVGEFGLQEMAAVTGETRNHQEQIFRMMRNQQVARRGKHGGGFFQQADAAAAGKRDTGYDQDGDKAGTLQIGDGLGQGGRIGGGDGVKTHSGEHPSYLRYRFRIALDNEDLAPPEHNRRPTLSFTAYRRRPPGGVCTCTRPAPGSI